MEAEYVGSEIKRQYLECVFANPQKIEYSEGTVGWRCTCICSSTMAIQEDVELTISSFNSDITLDVDTDIDDYVYPYLVITCTNASSETTVTITNKTDNNRAMQIKDATAGVVLYADCAMGTIINNAETEYYNKLVNQHFLRLLPGVNTISVTGNVESIKFTWQNARWMT